MAEAPEGRDRRRGGASAWPILTMLLAAAVVGLGIWGNNQMKGRRMMDTQLTNRYQQQFFEAVGHVDNVEVALAKTMVATSPRTTVSQLSDLWRQAWSAQASINQLPIGQGTLLRTSKFLTQVGDFSYQKTLSAAAGKPLSSEDHRKLQELRKEAEVLGNSLRTIAAKASEGKLNWNEIQRMGNASLREASKEVQDTDFTRLDKQMSEFPTLIYDGPFADHIAQRKPRGLGGGTVSQAEAEQIALKAFPGMEKNVTAQTTGQVSEPGIPAYNIEIRRGNDRRGEILARMDVSKQGGKVLSMLNPRTPTEQRINGREALARAEEYLKAQGFMGMESTFVGATDDEATIPFVSIVDGVIIYPDQVKVTVALDNGEILGFDALTYYMNHTQRQLPKPKITAEEARQKVDPAMNIETVRLALIPTEINEEVLTWEVRGKMDDTTFYVYINAETGMEERILQVIPTRSGGMRTL